MNIYTTDSDTPENNFIIFPDFLSLFAYSNMNLINSGNSIYDNVIFFRASGEFIFDNHTIIITDNSCYVDTCVILSGSYEMDTTIYSILYDHSMIPVVTPVILVGSATGCGHFSADRTGFNNDEVDFNEEVADVNGKAAGFNRNVTGSNEEPQYSNDNPVCSNINPAETHEDVAEFNTNVAGLCVEGVGMSVDGIGLSVGHKGAKVNLK